MNIKQKLKKWLDIETTEKNVAQIQQEIYKNELKQHPCKSYNAIEEFTPMNQALREIYTIKKYLKIEVKWHWEDDDDYFHQRPQKRVWEVVELKDI